MSEIKVNKVSPRSGTTVTLGDSGDTFTVPTGVTLDTSNSTVTLPDGSVTNAKLANSGITINGSSVSLGGSTTIETGTSWQSTIVTGTTLSAVAGNGYWIDTTSNACTVTLPASASVGDTIEFTDYARTWGTNRITLNTNSLNFQGNALPYPIYNTNGQHVTIVYSGATKGWIPNIDDDVTFETPQVIDFLVIGGGGAGGYDQGGGGGAGGYRTSYNNETSGGGGSAEDGLPILVGTTYTITVGAGAAGKNYTAIPVVGSNSSISASGITTITSTGGGGGGTYDGTAGSAKQQGANGGSGGGGGGYVGSGGNGTANQGYNGGNAATEVGGGGGGASAVGQNGTASTSAGNGGNGVASTITGSSVTRAGGGGGGCTGSQTFGSGGTGGGGDGTNSNSIDPDDGTANTGSGGGGCWTNAIYAGNGGSGLVVLRILASYYSGTTTGSPTVTDDGSFKVLTFTSSGSYTA
jgi:hypothetical protein